MLTTTPENRIVDERAADPDMRMTAYVYERVFGEAPGCVRHVPGALTLMEEPALTIGLPWGVIAAVGPGPTDVYSMNHHTDRYTGGQPPKWAVPAVAALRAHDALETRVVVHRELPFETGLSNGAETSCAVSQAVRDLYGLPGAPIPYDPASTTTLHAAPGQALLVTGETVQRLPCDLARAGLRLLIMDLGVDRTHPPAHGHAERAASALRAGDLAAFGAALTRAHTTSDAPFDLALDAAQGAGALGGLVVGRCAVAVVPLQAVPRVRQRVQQALTGHVRRPPRFLTAVPSGRR
ncbi:hypothetical protein [Actinomadura sp. 9N407]|uniref:hypothetical protein n=1 Tax=Actinomadura sp. 9N407 TaxID=3375154 RepID=UPI00379FA708